MAVWLFQIDLNEVLKTVIIAIIVITLGMIAFYFMWLKNEYFHIPTDHNVQHNYKTASSFFLKMKILINDFNNHDFWIKHIGFDGYCYLLFLRKLIIILATYNLIYGISSLIIYFLEGIMSMGYIEDVNFNESAGNIYSVFMVFTLTVLVLLMITNLRRDVQSIYFFYHSAPNVDKGLNFLRLRTVLFTKVNNYPMNGIKLKENIDKTFFDLSVYGKVFACRFLPDQRKLFRLEKDKKNLIFYNDLVNSNKLNFISKMLMKKSIKNNEKFQNQIRKIDKQIWRTLVKQKIKNSGYAFVCFNTLSAVNVLANTKNQKAELKNGFGLCNNNEDFQVVEFIDERDINWENCYVKEGIQLENIILTVFIFMVFFFMTTPAVLKTGEKQSYFLSSFLPPLLILLINRMILLLIFKKAQIKNSVRFSHYQTQVLDMAFFYILCNMLIFPGFAVPNAGANLFNIVTTTNHFDALFLNFYLLKSGDFFVTLLIQQICFGFFAGVTNLGLLYNYYFSPTAYLVFKSKNEQEKVFLKTETYVFDFGYINSINLTILGITFIYSIQIPLVVILGLIYFIMRFLTDTHLLLNLYKKEIESSAVLIHKIFSKTIFLLCFYQLCIFLKISYSDKFLGFLVLLMFILTVFVYILNLKKIMRASLFLDETYRLSVGNLKEWFRNYSHPLTMKMFSLKDYQKPKTELAKQRLVNEFKQYE